MISVYTFFVLLLGYSTATDEHELHKYLFDDYKPGIRPLYNVSKAVEVNLHLEVNQLSGVSATDEVMSLTGFLVAIWYDEFLVWDPAAYGGITRMIVPPTDVWKPDMCISNSIHDVYKETYSRDFRVDLQYDGRMIWSFGGIFETSCTLDMTYYPFDVQTCDVYVENWAYTKDQVDLKVRGSGVSLRENVDSGEWAVNKTTYSVSTFTEDTHPGYFFPTVTFTFYINRKFNYYFINIIAPCLLCVLISLLVFWLPPEAGEKIGLGITVLLAFSVFQLVVADRTPITSDFTPMITMLMIAIMSMTTFSVVCSTLVLYVYHHPTTSRPPPIVRTVMLKGLARIVCMCSLVPQDDEEEVEANGITLIQNKQSEHSPQSDMTSSSELKEILSQLKLLVDYIKHQEEDSSVADEWKKLALVMDRVFFWITFICSVTICIVFLANRDQH